MAITFRCICEYMIAKQYFFLLQSPLLLSNDEVVILVES